MLRRARSAFVAVSILGSACNFTQQGINPDPETLNYPIAIAIEQPDPAAPATHLVVANSNFDLRFNSGSVQVFDIPMIDAQIGGACGTPCVIEGTAFSDLLTGEVGIGSHAEGIAFGSDHSRLYIPVRRYGDLTWIDFDPDASGVLACGAQQRDPGSTDPDIARCDDDHRLSRREAVASERELDIVGDPIAVAVIPSSDLGADVGDFVLMVIRDGRVALFLDDDALNLPDDRITGPVLIHVASGFPENLVTITPQPGTGIAWMTAVGTDAIARVGIVVDDEPARSFLYDAGAMRLGGIDDGEDTRDLQFHPSRPDTAFVLARRPEAVIEVDLVRRGLSSIDLGVRDVFEVGRGPSRLATIEIDGRTYVLASCYDAQRIFVIDVEYGALVSVVGGFSGPFEMAVDPVAERLYVIDFIVSVIRVVDLSPLRTGGEPRVIATIGKPNPPRSLLD